MTKCVRGARAQSVAEHAVGARGLEKVAREISDSLEGTRPAPVKALVHLLRRVLETEESVTEGREERPESPLLRHSLRSARARSRERGGARGDLGRIASVPASLERTRSLAEVRVPQMPQSGPADSRNERIEEPLPAPLPTPKCRA